MRFGCLVLLLAGLTAVSLGAQSAGMRRSNGHSWTTAVSDGQTVPW